MSSPTFNLGPTFSFSRFLPALLLLYACTVTTRSGAMECATIQSVRQCCESQCAILQSDDKTTLRYRDYYDVPAKCVRRTEVHEKIATSQCFYLDMIDSLMALVPEQKIQEPTDAAVEMSTGNGQVKIVKRTDGKDGEYEILPCIDGLEKKDIGIEYVRAMRTNEAFSSKTGVMCIDGDVFHNEVVLLASFVESDTLTQAGTVESVVLRDSLVKRAKTGQKIRKIVSSLAKNGLNLGENGKFRFKSTSLPATTVGDATASFNTKRDELDTMVNDICENGQWSSKEPNDATNGAALHCLCAIVAYNGIPFNTEWADKGLDFGFEKTSASSGFSQFLDQFVFEKAQNHEKYQVGVKAVEALRKTPENKAKFVNAAWTGMQAADKKKNPNKIAADSFALVNRFWPVTGLGSRGNALPWTGEGDSNNIGPQKRSFCFSKASPIKQIDVGDWYRQIKIKKKVKTGGSPHVDVILEDTSSTYSGPGTHFPISHKPLKRDLNKLCGQSTNDVATCIMKAFDCPNRVDQYAYESPLYRFVANDEHENTVFTITSYNLNTDHRWTGPGIPGIYTSTDRTLAIFELSQKKYGWNCVEPKTKTTTCTAVCKEENEATRKTEQKTLNRDVEPALTHCKTLVKKNKDFCLCKEGRVQNEHVLFYALDTNNETTTDVDGKTTTDVDGGVLDLFLPRNRRCVRLQLDMTSVEDNSFPRRYTPFLSIKELTGDNKEFTQRIGAWAHSQGRYHAIRVPSAATSPEEETVNATSPPPTCSSISNDQQSTNVNYVVFTDEGSKYADNISVGWVTERGRSSTTSVQSMDLGRPRSSTMSSLDTPAVGDSLTETVSMDFEGRLSVIFKPVGEKRHPNAILLGIEVTTRCCQCTIRKDGQQDTICTAETTTGADDVCNKVCSGYGHTLKGSIEGHCGSDEESGNLSPEHVANYGDPATVKEVEEKLFTQDATE